MILIMMVFIFILLILFGLVVGYFVCKIIVEVKIVGVCGVVE